VSARVRPAIAEATARLAAASVASPRTDAELLAAFVLGVPRGRLVLADDFTGAQAAAFAALVGRRAAREPLQHLTGSVHFGGVDLAVGPGVFIPRPETELLVDWATKIRDLGAKRPPSEITDLGAGAVVLDLGSGSGAIALAMAHAWPDARVVAVEQSPAALAWLRRNAAARKEAGDTPITVVEGDATDLATTAAWRGRVDLLLSNPPYVPDATPVPPEVADHDPAAAVFGGPDGLDVIRRIVTLGLDLLRPGGRVAIEHDDTHATAVVDLLAGRYTDAAMHRDLAGRPRFSTARRP